MNAKFSISAVVLLVTFAMLLPATADARAIRIDRQTGFIPGAELANDGFRETDLVGVEEDFDTGEQTEVPFSINYFGTEYSSMFINENGVISFGAPLSGPPREVGDIFNTGIPVIAPFFADADMAATRFELGTGEQIPGRVNLAYTFGINMFVNFLSTYQGSEGTPTLQNETQVALFSSVASTDFTLEFNYGDMQWESGDLDGGINGLGGIAPRIGFSNGLGLRYEAPGSGMNGVLLGDVFPPAEDCPPGALAVGCNDYVFRFIDGVPYQNGAPLALQSVSEPGSWALILLGLGALATFRRRQSNNASYT